MNRIIASALPRNCVLAVEVDGDEFVLWRAREGRVCSAPRVCPHLDHDLVEGYVDGDDLVCAGHGWAFDGNGNAFKRNEFGRVDPKGKVATLEIGEVGDQIELRRGQA
jgi:phenylpropionate dioxygenase-like ring-hydroxylating dioxygenase large terminal subunit